MSKISPSELKSLQTFACLAYSNPFSRERIDLEKLALGDAFVADDSLAWSRSFEQQVSDRPNVRKIAELASGLVGKFNQCAANGQSFTDSQLNQYWDVVTYVLLYRHVVHLSPDDVLKPAVSKRMWSAFQKDYEHFVSVEGLDRIELQSADHLFAILCQVHRAFSYIFYYILGDSLPSVKLRESVWQSVFTNDLRRYRRVLFDRMSTLPTLITGPSGTGKELAAQAIGASQYIPFDAARGCFPKESVDCFIPLNLSAMSPTLIESELFGHRKGAFTGAVGDRAGWLGKCPSFGAVFLDEIGELDLMLQVKLLRVVQQRTYTALGEDQQQQFLGKIIGATNRDLDHEMAEGRFREDLYYRLCADRIQTPSLRSQLHQNPEDLPALVRYVSRKLAGDDSDALADQATEWIRKNLGDNYPWRGNIRELEHCVSSIMIRSCYSPAGACNSGGDLSKVVDNQPGWAGSAVAGNLTADQLLQQYCHWIHQKTGSYEATARKLGIDRRTVKAKIALIE
jgi:hypothetical protein